MPSTKVPVQHLSAIIKHQIIFEEWISSEFEYVARTSDQADWLLNYVSFKPVNGLLLRPPKEGEITPSVSFIDYVIQKGENQTKHLNIVFSMPVFRMLDNKTFIILMRIIKDTIELYLKKSKQESEVEDEQILLWDCENEAQENYRREVTSLSNESLKHFATSQRNLNLYLKTMNMQGSEIFDAKQIIRNVVKDYKLEDRLNAIYSKVRSRFNDPSTVKLLREVKVKIFPALFTFVDTESTNRHVSSIQSMMVYDQFNVYSFSIILVSDQLLKLESLTDNEVEIMLAYEISFLLSKRSFNRGEMEKEIYNLLSVKSDPTVSSINRMYTADMVEKTRKKVNDIILNLYGSTKSLIQVS